MPFRICPKQTTLPTPAAGSQRQLGNVSTCSSRNCQLRTYRIRAALLSVPLFKERVGLGIRPEICSTWHRQLVRHVRENVQDAQTPALGTGRQHDENKNDCVCPKSIQTQKRRRFCASLAPTALDATPVLETQISKVAFKVMDKSTLLLGKVHVHDKEFARNHKARVAKSRLTCKMLASVRQGVATYIAGTFGDLRQLV